MASEVTATEPKRYFWKQCYELGDDTHWALCDTESEKEGRVSSFYLVLLARHKTAIDGKPVDQQPELQRIVDLLNADESAKRNGG